MGGWLFARMERLPSGSAPLYFPPLERKRHAQAGFQGVLSMTIDVKPGQTVRVTIRKQIRRESARKTLERLFMKDRSIAGPLMLRARNFRPLPKRRGGRIWTKRPNKVHPQLSAGTSATIKVTPQVLHDLASVKQYIEVSAQ